MASTACNLSLTHEGRIQPVLPSVVYGDGLSDYCG
jgi:hypothetical protein